MNSRQRDGDVGGGPRVQACMENALPLLHLAAHQLLKEFGNLSRALRPRVLWAVARAAHLPPHADEAWEAAARALEMLLLARWVGQAGRGGGGGL